MEYVTKKLGSNTEDVREVKEMLRSLGYPIWKLDHTFDENTRNSVLAFQNDFGLRMTGVVDEDTYKALKEAVASRGGNIKEESKNAVKAPVAEEVSPIQKTQTTREPQIEQAPQNVPELELSPEFRIVSESGFLQKSGMMQEPEMMQKPQMTQEPQMAQEPKMTQEPQMAQEPGMIQESQMMPKPQIEQVPEMYIMPVQEEVSEQMPVQESGQQQEAMTMEQGDTGKDIVRMQIALKNLKYYEGMADGIFGKQTTEAVKKFQKENGLKTDGKVGSKTKETLHKIPMQFYAELIQDNRMIQNQYTAPYLTQMYDMQKETAAHQTYESYEKNEPQKMFACEECDSGRKHDMYRSYAPYPTCDLYKEQEWNGLNEQYKTQKYEPHQEKEVYESYIMRTMEETRKACSGCNNNM